MNKKELIIVTIIAIAFGTSMHFVHHLPFFNHFMGYIFPVCESVWEHMKMLFYPMLLTSIYLSISRKDITRFGGMIASCLISMPTQIILFYAYWIFVRHSILIVDIIAYIAVMIMGYCLGNRLSKLEAIQKSWKLWIGVAVILIITIAVLSYHYPEINLFVAE